MATRTTAGIAVWVLGILALLWLEVSWLQLAFSDWSPDWKFAILPLPPFLLLVFGSWPTDRWLWLRRISFYVGLGWWIWLILGVVFGMFNAEFSLVILVAGAVGLILVSMFAPRKAKPL